MTTRPKITVDYTSRDYDAIKNDLIKLVNQQLKDLYPQLQWDANDPSDFGVVLLESFAYMGDIMSYYIDRAANETSIDTAVQKSTIYNIAQIYGYRPSGPTPATVSLTFTNNSGETISLPIGTQAMAYIAYGDYPEIYFETVEAIASLAPNGSATVLAKEGKTSNTDTASGISPTTNLPIPVLLVNTAGSSASTGLANQERIISEKNIIDGSVKVYVGQGTGISNWRFVDNLIEAGPLDQVFSTKINSDGTTSIVFGDGINGAIPASGQTLSALYKTSAGYAGNVDASAISEVTYIPGIGLNPTSISVINADGPATGGANPDDITQVKKKIKKAMSSRRRAVTLTDYEDLASLVPMVGRVKAIAANPRSVTLYMQSQDDGSTYPGWDPDLEVPTAQWDDIASEIVLYLSDKIQIGTSVTVEPPVYKDIALTLTVVADSNYKNNDVKLAVSNALLSQSDGLFSYKTYEFGETVALSDIFYKVMSVPGVRNLNVNLLDFVGGSASADRTLGSNELPRLMAINLTINVSGGIS